MEVNFKIWEMTLNKISDKDLQIIADADYGMDWDDHYAELRKIYDTSIIPKPLKWEPHEVVSLTRWSDYRKYSDDKTRVLFCSLILILAFHEDDEGYIHSVNESIIASIDICEDFGRDWLIALKEMLEGLHAEVDIKIYEEEILYLPLGIWVISNLLDQACSEINKWKTITDKETRRLTRSDYYEPKKSILAYTFHNLRHEKWAFLLNKFSWIDLDAMVLWDEKYK